jgi:sugar phosphate permease
MTNPSTETQRGRAEPLQTGWSRWRILVLLMALCFISHFNRASMANAGDERIMAQFGITTKQMGVIYSAFLIVYTVFMIPGGLFIDRYGPRRALAAMGFATAAFCAFTGMVGWGTFASGTQVWLTLIAVRALMGFFTTPLHPACARTVSNWFPAPQQSLANGLVTGAALMAYALVHPVFGRLIDWVDWTNAFFISAVATALITGVWLVCGADRPLQVAPSNMPTAQGLLSGLGSLLRHRSLWFLTLSYSAVGYFQYLFFYWMHYYFDEILHMGKIDSRFYASLPNLAMAVGMPLGGWLTDGAQRLFGSKPGRTLVPKIGMALSAVFLALGIFARDRSWVVLWFTLSLGVLGLCEGSFWTSAVEIGGRHGGSAAAIMNTGGNGIGLLAPMITPFVSDALGWKWGIGLGALICVGGALCWFWIDPSEKNQPPAPL